MFIILQTVRDLDLNHPPLRPQVHLLSPVMAENHQSHGDFTNMSSSNQVFSNTTTTSSYNNEIQSGTQQHISDVTEHATPFDGILRTASGRETYFPDGHQSSSQAHTRRSEGSGGYGLFPSTEKRDTHASGSLTTGGLATAGAVGAGAGLFSEAGRHEDTTRNDEYLHNGAEDQVPLEKVATANSSESSFTQYGSNGQAHHRKGIKVSDTDDSDGSPMYRSVTRPEIDHEERSNLQRALTSMSMSTLR